MKITHRLLEVQSGCGRVGRTVLDTFHVLILGPAAISMYSQTRLGEIRCVYSQEAVGASGEEHAHDQRGDAHLLWHDEACDAADDFGLC